MVDLLKYNGLTASIHIKLRICTAHGCSLGQSVPGARWRCRAGGWWPVILIYIVLYSLSSRMFEVRLLNCAVRKKVLIKCN